MTEFYTVKHIDNSRLIRPTAPNRLRECCRLVAFGALLAAGGLLYTWQHFQCIRVRYQLEELRAERGQAAELHSRLTLEAATLRSPMRIDAIARQHLGLMTPQSAQVVRLEGPSEAALAQAHPLAAPAAQ